MMDPEVSVLLHCAAWRGLLESQVQVELSERFNRQTDSAVERQIEEVWAERVSKEPWLFNGSKFRLHSFCLASPVWASERAADQEGELHSRLMCDAARNKTNGPLNQAERKDGVAGSTLSQASSAGGGPEHIRAERPCCSEGTNKDGREPGPLLTLRLGLTCYKDYLGTNWSRRAAELQRRGAADFRDPAALLAQPLGVGGVLCTDDGQVVLIRRSQRVAEAGGLLDIPGGHPEPKAACERPGPAVSDEQVRLSMMQRSAVVSELFSSVCTEIRDEVNIPLSALGAPVLMGVALNHTSAGRPSAEFYISCSLTSDEIRKLYWKGGAEASESTDIVFLNRTEVLHLDSSSPLWAELCPSAKGAVLLYQAVKPDGERGPSR